MSSPLFGPPPSIMPRGAMSGGYTYDDSFWNGFQGAMAQPNQQPPPVGPPVEQPAAPEPVTPPPAVEQPSYTGFDPTEYMSTIDPALIQKLTEQANSDPNWGKAIAIGAIAMTNPEMAFRMLEQDEGAKKSADAMLTQLGIQEAAGRRDWNRQKFLLEVQDKKQLAAEERQQKQLESAEIRGWEDEAAKLGAFVKLPTDRKDPNYKKKLIEAVNTGQEAKLQSEQRKKQVEAYNMAFRAAKLPPPQIADPYSDEGFAQLQASADGLISDTRYMDYLRQDAIKIAEQTGNAQSAIQAFENIQSPALKEQAMGFVEAARAAAARTVQIKQDEIDLARMRVDNAKNNSGAMDLVRIMNLEDKGNDNWLAVQSKISDEQVKLTTASTRATALAEAGRGSLAEAYALQAQWHENNIAGLQAKLKRIEAAIAAMDKAGGGGTDTVSKSLTQVFGDVADEIYKKPIPGFDTMKWAPTGTTDLRTALIKYLSNNWSNDIVTRGGRRELNPYTKDLLQKLYDTYLAYNPKATKADFMIAFKDEMARSSNDWSLGGALPQGYMAFGDARSLEGQPDALSAIESALNAAGGGTAAIPPPGQPPALLQQQLNQLPPTGAPR